MTVKFQSFDPTKKILITGAAGFVGFHLAKKLLDQGANVVGFDSVNDYYDVRLKLARLEILRKRPRFAFVQGDLADEVAVRTLFAEFRPEIVVNLAAQVGVRYSIENPKAYINSNIVGFFNLLEAVRRRPVAHLVYASSSSVYGDRQKTPFSTADRADEPISFYAATKKSNELLAYSYSHLYRIPSTGLRFFTVYGPFGRPDMATFIFTRKIFDDEPIWLFNNGDMRRDFTFVDDVVRCVEKILVAPPQPNASGVPFKIYNVGNGRPENLLTVVETLERKIGKTAKKEFLPTQPGDVYQTFADVGELVRDFDFRPDTSLEVGLGKFVDWYREFYRGATDR